MDHHHLTEGNLKFPMPMATMVIRMIVNVPDEEQCPIDEDTGSFDKFHKI